MGMRGMLYLTGCFVTLAAAGCDPVVSIAGANFPGWLLCAGTGSLLATLCHPLLVVTGLERELHPLPVFYAGLIAMFSLVGWLIFFSRV